LQERLDSHSCIALFAIHRKSLKLHILTSLRSPASKLLAPLVG